MELTEKKCVACEGGVRPLEASQAKALLQKIPGWTLSPSADSITRGYEFSNFKKSLNFINQVGEIAEQEKHHPDLAFGWGYARITLQTHSIGGLHENDFILAAKINALGL